MQHSSVPPWTFSFILYLVLIVGVAVPLFDSTSVKLLTEFTKVEIRQSIGYLGLMISPAFLALRFTVSKER